MRRALLPMSLLLALAAVTPAAGAEHAPAAAKPEPPSRIQMPGLMAPVRWADGRIGKVAVTPLLDLADVSTFDAVCDLAPRVRDAVIATLYRVPLPSLGRGKFDVEAIDRPLTTAINAALGHPLVGGVDLVPGVYIAKSADPRFHGAAPCAKKKAKAKAPAD